MRKFTTHVNVRYDDKVDTIGVVCPPARKYRNQDEVDKALARLWEEWREEVEFPDSDSQFITWLIEKHGWQEYSVLPSVTLY